MFDQAFQDLAQHIAALVLAGLQPTQAAAAPPQATTPAAPPYVPPQAAPVTQPAPAPPAAAMPTAPSFLAQPAPPVAAPVTPAGPALPFADAKGLTDYVMATYKTLGPEKGAQIQGIIQHLGHQNVNDLRPDQYAQFHGFVEQLKAS